MSDILNIAGRIHSISEEGIATTASEIKDEGVNKRQSTINAEVQSELGNQSAAIDALENQNYVNISATNADTTIEDVFTRLGITPSADTIYRVANWKYNATTKYNTSYFSEYSVNISGSTVTYVPLMVVNLGIDSVPVAGSENLVQSGGVFDGIMQSGVFDLSAHNSGDTYADLSAALTAMNSLTAAYKKGGMSIKFVQSSDNNSSQYVQYFLTKNQWSTSEADWQKMNLEEEISQLGQQVSELSVEDSLDLDEEIKVTSEDGQTIILEISSGGVNAKDLKSNGIPVITDVSNLATKTELQTGLDGKQDIIEEISIDDTHNSETEEQKWVSDDYNEDEETGEEYARIDKYGVHAKCFIVLNGKKWAPLGDSFTAGATASTFVDGKYKGKKKVYPYYIGNRTGLNIVDTFFASGRTLAFPANPGTFTNSICNPNAACYYQNIPADVDYITIYLGINDSHHAPGSGGGDGEDNTGEIPIGTIDDATTATYYGAWNVVLSWLIQNRPFAHIGILVSNGCDTADYRTAQIAIARKYGIPFIDLNGDDRTPFMIRSTNPDIPSGIRSLRTQAQAVNYPSNTHPNDDAHLFESWFIEEFLKTI